MPRTQISIKLDDDILARIDRLAADVGSTRTAVIEKAIENDLPEQEAFHRSLENPVVRAVHAQLTRPAVLGMIAKLANERLSDSDLAALIDRAQAQRDAATERRSSRGTRGK